MTVKDTDERAEKVRTGFRITLAYMEAGIAEKHFFMLGDALFRVGAIKAPVDQHPAAVMTMCVLVMRNGWVVVGKTAPVDPANFNRDLGEQFAYDDAVKQLWPLYAFAHKEGGLT